MRFDNYEQLLGDYIQQLVIDQLLLKDKLLPYEVLLNQHRSNYQFEFEFYEDYIKKRRLLLKFTESDLRFDHCQFE